MSDLLKNEITGAPVTVFIEGKSYPLVYKMAACIVYKQETARIERSRPQPLVNEKDVVCLRCGAARAEHEGPNLIRLAPDKEVLCWRFDGYNPVQGDSLFFPSSWTRIDLDVDPERWIACLWAGLHQLQPDGLSWKAPMTLAQLSGMIPIGDAARQISLRMVKAVNLASTKAKEPDPNAPPAPAKPAAAPEEKTIPIVAPTSDGSGPAPDAASDSLIPNS